MCSLSSVFVSCTKDDVLDKQNTNGRTPITFISGINTRSINVDLQKTQIANGVKVGVFVNGTSDLVADNQQLLADGAGNFTGEAIFYPEDNSAISVYAYAPFSSDWVGNLNVAHSFTVATDQSTDEAYLASDLLWGIPMGENSFISSKSPITLNFKHKLSKLNLNFNTGETGVNLKGAIVSILNTKPTTTLNVQDGTLEAASGAATEITAVKFADDASIFSASVILVPQKIAAANFIKIITAEKEYIAALNTDLTFGEGKVYTYTVKFGVSGGEETVELVLGSVIDDWENGNEDLEGDAKGPQPVVDRVSHTMAKVGERIRIYGANFKGVKKIVFPGDVEAMTLVESESELDAAGEFWIHSAEDNSYQMIDVIIPEGGDQVAGALYVEAETGNRGYSYSYMNCKDNIFISKFTGDAYQMGGSNIYATNQIVPESNWEMWPGNPENIRTFGDSQDGDNNPDTKGISYAATAESDQILDGYKLKTSQFSFSLSKMCEKIPNGITDCDDLAIQFDCYMSSEEDNGWTTGALRWALGYGGDEITYTPWWTQQPALYDPITVDFSSGWKTLTFPMKDFKNTSGKKVEEIPDGNGQLKLIFGSFAPYGEGSRGTAVTNFLMYMANFRIVPYTKP